MDGRFGTIIAEAIRATGVPLGRSPGALSLIEKDLTDAVEAAAKFIRDDQWTPAAIHLRTEGDELKAADAWLLHGETFILCENLDHIPLFTFRSVNTPTSLKITRDDRDAKPTLAATLDFSDGREPITFEADNPAAVTHLETTIKNHLLPLFK